MTAEGDKPQVPPQDAPQARPLGETRLPPETQPQTVVRTPLDEIDRLVHEPARYLILAHLYVVESADFVFLLHQTRLTKGNLSSHLRKLEEAGYVAVEKKFVERIPRTLLALTAAGRRALEAYRLRMQELLGGPPGR